MARIAGEIHGRGWWRRRGAVVVLLLHRTAPWIESALIMLGVQKQQRGVGVSDACIWGAIGRSKKKPGIRSINARSTQPGRHQQPQSKLAATFIPHAHSTHTKRRPALFTSRVECQVSSPTHGQARLASCAVCLLAKRASGCGCAAQRLLSIEEVISRGQECEGWSGVGRPMETWSERIAPALAAC